MAPKTSKKTSKKPSMAKAKRMVGRRKGAAAKKNLDTFFLRCKTLYNQIPTQGISVSNYVYGASQLLGSNLLNNAEFNFYRLQYDRFRVNRLRFTCTPKANVLDQLTAQADTSATLIGDGMIHTAIDRDGLAPSSIALISRYPSYKAFSLLKKWSRTYQVKYPVGVWLDAQNPTDVNKAGLIDSLGLAGGITMYAENLPEDTAEIFNEPFAEIKMEFDVVFQGKTSGSMQFTLDENQKVIGVSLNAVQSGEGTKSLSELRDIRGSIADTKIIETTDDADVPILDSGDVVD